MKRNLLFLAVMVLGLFLLSGCGGDDGKVYLKIVYSGSLSSYTDSNNDVPDNPVSGYETETSAGEYSYQYQLSGCSTIWYGTYKLEADEGDSVLPIDGDDRHYTMTLTCSSGPDLSVSSLEGSSSEDSTSSASDTNTPQSGTKVLRSGGWKMTINYNSMPATEETK